MVVSNNRELISVISLIDRQHYLTKGKSYLLKRGPDMVNPFTYDKINSYIVKCDSGSYIKADLNNFQDLIEIREEKLNSLGI